MRIKNLLLMGPVCGEKIIRNINIPSCRNCKYYQPTIYDTDFTSTLIKCNKFGHKHIVTDEIIYDYADSCRTDENKCGEKGIYFEQEQNINMKILKHKILSNGPFIMLITFSVASIILSANNLVKTI
jgi:hypothetical protein